MHILKATIAGNPNIGLYGFVNDKFLLLGTEVPKEQAKKFGEILGVPVHRITLAGTSLIGVFIAGNNSTILIPEIVFPEELEILDKLGIKYDIISTHLTALGNNILCNDKGAVINPEFSEKERVQIEKALCIETIYSTIAELEIVGALGAINNKGCLTHREIEKSELQQLNKLLGVPIESSTLNLGSPYISSGIIVNNNGFIVGELSGGPEITFADEVFGFLQK